MDAPEAREAYPGLQEATFNPRNAVTWIGQKPAASQVSYACDIFEDLLQNASKPKQSSGHACVKLCGFVEQCAKSETTALREYAFAEQTAYDLFNFYLEWNEQDQHRSMRLILDFLKTSILNNLHSQTGQVIKSRILTDLISFITLKSAKPTVKSALTSLDYFLQKRVFYLSDVIDTYQRIHKATEQSPSWDAFVSKIFQWMQMKNTWPIAGKFLATIFSLPWYEDQETRFLPEAWHKFLHAGLTVDIELLEPVQLYTLIPLFTSDKDQMLHYLDHLFSIQNLTKDQSNIDVTSMIWLAALESGKKTGVVGEPTSELTETTSSNTVGNLQKDVLEDILAHSSQEARSSAVSILIASPSTAKPYSPASLELLQKHLPAFHADGDAKFRYDVLGYSRNMISRILGAITGISRDIERRTKKAKKNDTNGSTTDEISQLKHLSDQHSNFLIWYFGFLKHELTPSASYQRHITSLKAMELILRTDSSGSQTQDGYAGGSLSLVDLSWLRSVLDLVVDPFEDVRETAANLLILLSTMNIEMAAIGLARPMLQELEEFCARASTLASKTSRADHSDGVARSYEVLCQWTTSKSEKLAIPARLLAEVEAKLTSAEKDLASAVLEAPIHGTFAALRHVWQSLSNLEYSSDELQKLSSLQSRVISCCIRIWHAVKLVLCDDSPEGHLPEELEEVDELDTKDLLSYSFRAIHESSHLLRVIASNLRSNKPASIRPSDTEFEEIGNLTFTQLSSLRHRGAFTTVSQTFASCCQSVKYCSVSPGEESTLLSVWYKGALKCIYTEASTTRRSAGIPALIVGILSSNAEQPSFGTVINELQGIARKPAHITETDRSNLPQVHATNCIKDIFKSSMLSRRAEPYLTDCLQLAANSLKSEVWAIRNCGLILLRSLIDCLFGTSESKTSMEAGWDGRSTRVAWHKYKSLPLLLVTLLKSGQSSTNGSKEMTRAESVFPALDIIRRAGPPQEFKDELFGVVAWYLGSHIWHVREIAARTLCSFLLQEDWFERIRSLLAETHSSANRLHGALLTFKSLLERLLDAMPEQLLKHYPDDLHRLVQEVAQTPGSFQTCSEARAVHYEIINFLNALTSKQKLSDETAGSSLLDPSLFGAPASRSIPQSLMESKEAQAHTVYEMEQISSGVQHVLDLDVHVLLRGDANVATDALQTILSYVQTEETLQSRPGVAPQIIELCATVLHETDASEVRRLAVEILAIQLNGNIEQATMDSALQKDQLVTLWSGLQDKSLNPGLADSVIRASGTLVKTVTAQVEGNVSERWLRSWGVMMRKAGSVENSFDTRVAGIQAILSFTRNKPLDATQPANIPWLLALYDHLNDDDEEIREIAASATTPILGKPVVSIEASVRLLAWLVRHHGSTEELRTHAACRMIGHPAISARVNNAELQKLTPAETQLSKAMRFDASLFAVEEQNMYVDEVREALRWRSAFQSLSYPRDDAALKALVDWTIAGLRTLSKVAGERGDDGVLGWTSKPEVFAICSRVVVSGVALATAHEEVRVELRKFVEKGRETRVHGLLLEMCESTAI